VELVRRGLVASREQARAEIEEGRVLVSGAPASKPSRLVSAAEPIRITGPRPRFVSRGGEKLDAALEHFGIDVTGWRVLDAGASTGGFTDCLLQRGASRVVALDVGYGQLHDRLRRDPRVQVVERTNLRHVEPAALDAPFDAVVADLSFISLRTVAGELLSLAAPGGTLVLLVKPQFEAGREEATRGRGVIREPGIWQRVLEEVVAVFEHRGAIIMGLMVSPLPGSDGNVEFLLWLRAPSDGGCRSASGAAREVVTRIDVERVVVEASRMRSG
jgi:23S rRNA (cytidine1920-2'-O)/16S rRNA (cytidine1409-2'-O)-methyltransferase